jgi:hypothetical protein
MFSVTNKGDFHNLERFLKKNKQIDIDHYLEEFGQAGVEALRKATPKDTGLTSESWYYEIDKGKFKTTITWKNSNVIDDWYNVAIGIQYGHGTANGVYVQGIDYINPAMSTIFDELANQIWEEVTNA